MVNFRFSVTNGHYQKGDLVPLAENTAKLFESLKWGVIEKEVKKVERPKTTKKDK